MPILTRHQDMNAGVPQSIDNAIVTEEAIESLLNRYHELDVFNGAALVAENGKVIFKKGFGLADFEWRIPVTTDTKFRLGSITKQFTAALLLQLVEEGKVSLETSLGDALPCYRKDTGAIITIHQLLTHTSGIPSYTGLPNFKDVRRGSYAVRDFVLEYCSGDLEFEPGAKFRYNNSGYFLLGAIIEQAIINKSKIKIHRFPIPFTEDQIREWAETERLMQAEIRQKAIDHPYNEVMWRQNKSRCWEPYRCSYREICLSSRDMDFRAKWMRDNTVERRWDFVTPETSDV